MVHPGQPSPRALYTECKPQIRQKLSKVSSVDHQHRLTNQVNTRGLQTLLWHFKGLRDISETQVLVTLCYIFASYQMVLKHSSKLQAIKTFLKTMEGKE